MAVLEKACILLIFTNIRLSMNMVRMLKMFKMFDIENIYFELDPNLGEDGIFTTTLTLTGQKITVTLIDFPGQEGN